jgi:acetyl esterase/lipase
MTRRVFCLAALALSFTLAGAASAAPVVQRNLAYGEYAGEQLTFDVYRPDSRGPHPAVLIIHGGGWQHGDKKAHERTGMMLAENGYAAFSINYRLAPKHPYPAALDDCQRAVRWIRYNAPDFDVDPERIGALGDSAGGHLASLLGLLGTRSNRDTVLARESSRVQAVVNYYGPSDLSRLWAVEAVRPLLSAWLGGSPEEQAKRYRAASPLAAVNGKAAPFLIFHGDKDELVPDEQAGLLHEALRKSGAESTLHVFKDAGHGWSPTSEHGKTCQEAILTFFGKHLRKR